MRVLLLSLLFALVSCDNPQKPAKPLTPKQQVRRKIGPSVVRITGSGSGGTGFSVKAPSGFNYILTNKHICSLRDANNMLTVEFPSLKRKYDRRVIEINKKHDLCLVESIPAIDSALKISDKLETGDGIYVVGHPKLYALTVAEGEFIEEAEIKVAMSKTTLKPVVIVPNPKLEGGGFTPVVYKFKSSRFNVYSRGGNSGSPIVNFNGEVVSVLFAGNPYDNHETYGVPLRYVKEFLEGY